MESSSPCIIFLLSSTPRFPELVDIPSVPLKDAAGQLQEKRAEERMVLRSETCNQSSHKVEYVQPHCMSMDETVQGHEGCL